MAGQAEERGRLVGEAQSVALIIASVAVIALWWRRRHPVGLVLVMLPLLLLTDLVLAPFLVAVYTLTASRRWSIAAGVVGGSLAVYLPYSITMPGPDLTAFNANVLNFALMATAVAIGANTRQRREALAALRERAARAGADASLREQRLRDQERGRIAREMHDVLAHRISLVSLMAGALEVRPNLSAEDVAKTASTIRSNAHQALEDLRDILGVLRADSTNGALRPQPTLGELDDLLTECRMAGAEIDVENRLGDMALPPLISRTAYRIVQEGLTNVRKHAAETSATLLLDRTPDGELHIWLHNPLTGTTRSTVPGTHSGLVGLAERVSLAGGRFDHGARRAGDGKVAFHIEAWLPWPT
jgi:signal transduction histidine kinase